MLFNSFIFLFVFLPLAYLGGMAISKVRPTALVPWMGIASIVFYLWWSVHDTVILVASIVCNYAIASYMLAEKKENRRKQAMVGGIALNLCTLAYYKYANFFIHNVSALLQTDSSLISVALPLGISFFTFTQIAFLVDCKRHDVSHHSFANYFLFVTYFPHLIAGPIIHHKEMMPQFSSMHERVGRSDLLSVGLTILIIGLFKKVVLADSIAPYADAVFDRAAFAAPGFFEAWCGSTAYAMQIYFDFSAYSDMAIGISYMFGVRLPLNFDSPYKARNIIDFWRRWHITLSRFLRDHLYFPLGGNRLGPPRRIINLMATMLLGGLWHGANWPFVIWGALHGAFLAVNHGFQAVTRNTKIETMLRTRAGTFLCTAFTFLCVVFAWAYFRAADLESAHNVIRGMLGLNGFQLPDRYVAFLGPWVGALNALGIQFVTMETFGSKQQIAWTLALLFISFCLPNIREIMCKHAPALELRQSPDVGTGRQSWYVWMPTLPAIAITGALSITVLWLMLSGDEVRFIYFTF